MTSTHEPKRHRRRAHSRSQSISSHQRPQDHEATSVPQSTPSDDPVILEDIRRARIAHLETPAHERSSAMKHEYTRKATSEKTTGTSQISPKKRTTAQPEKNATSKGERKKRESSVRQSETPVREVSDEYVYHPTPNAVINDEEQGTTEKNGSESTATGVSRAGTKVERRTSARRHTVPTHEMRSAISPDGSAPPPASITQLRKSNAITSSSTRPPIKRNAMSEISTSDTASVVSTSRKRSSSVFGGLFSPKPPPAPEPKVSCLTCGDDLVKSRTAKLPCTHRMCHSCLKRIFKMSITDPAHMPPKCCTDQHIDVKHVDKLFNDDFKKTYNRKFKEYNSKNRIYCPKKGCGQWIQPKHMSNERGRKVGKCPTCKTQVCSICNQKMHKSRDCPKDPATKQFAEVAKKSGWQKCYNCSATVELKEGCNHMTCRCTAEFCMVCGLKWKSCDCPWFNYNQVDINGDPVRYQQEIDRRRDQEHRDAELARRMEAFQMDDDARHLFGLDNAPGYHLNQNFIQQAREALTANYQIADQAARELFNGFLVGREAPELDPASLSVGTNQDSRISRSSTHRRQLTSDPAEGAILTPVGIPVVRRHGQRRRRNMPSMAEEQPQPQINEEHDQERRMREWANDVHDQ